MQLTVNPEYDAREAVLPPLEMGVCHPTQEDQHDDHNVPNSPQPSLLHDDLTYAILPPNTERSKPLMNNNTENTSSQRAEHRCTCTEEIPGNTRKRKLPEGVERELQKRKRLLIKRRILNSISQSRENMPLFYLYGDLLLIPKFMWGRHGDVHSGRSLSLEPDLSTPIDSGTTLEPTPHLHRPRTPSLFHVQVSPDSQSLEEGGIGQERFSDVLKQVIKDLNQYGVCAVDNFLGAERAEQIFGEVGALHSQGVFRDGQVVSRQVQSRARGMVRGDKITWVTGAEPNCSGIGQLVSVVDSLVAKANKHQDNGELANYNITWRTRAMVACYPGEDTHYVKHVDNPNGDGRCITAIYYVNKGWSPEDGGVLRIYPEGCSDKVAEIEPLFDRMLFFWSDRRNPHEVLPAKITRYAITVWYLDQKEREDYLARVHSSSAHT